MRGHIESNGPPVIPSLETKEDRHDGQEHPAGGPLWRRVLVAILGFALLGAWLLFSDKLVDKADGSPAVVKITNEQTFDYAPPDTMKARFQGGRDGNAGGADMPDWVFRQAKDYVMDHPWVAPGGTAPKAGEKRGDWDWGWLEWTAKTLNTGRCLSVGPSPITWFGCSGQPDWVHTVRSVKVKCGGAMLIIAGLTENLVAVGSGGAVCFWNQFNNFYGGGKAVAASRNQPFGARSGRVSY